MRRKERLGRILIDGWPITLRIHVPHNVIDILLLALIGRLLVYYRVCIWIQSGPCWDSDPQADLFQKAIISRQNIHLCPNSLNKLLGEICKGQVCPL